MNKYSVNKQILNVLLFCTGKHKHPFHLYRSASSADICEFVLVFPSLKRRNVKYLNTAAQLSSLMLLSK